MKAVNLSNLFAVNTELEVELIELEGARLLIVDNFYKNPHALRDFLLESPAPMWKTAPFGKNFIRYHDCRHQIDGGNKLLPPSRMVAALARKYLQMEIPVPVTRIESNLFQLIKPQLPNTIPRPHLDGEVVAALVGLNLPEECHGGTGFYRSRFNQVMNSRRMQHELEQEALDKWMEQNGLVETGYDYFLKGWEEYWQLEYLAETRFNRLVMFDGELFHGAYHVDNHYMDYPRINHMMFFDTIRRIG